MKLEAQEKLMKLKYYKRSAVIFVSRIIPPQAEDIEDIRGIPPT
jgi:hypothetical protein